MEANCQVKLFLVLVICCALSNGDCKMYGICSTNLYCLESGPARAVTNSTYSSVCGVDYATQCCDEKQLNALKNNLMMLAVILDE